jgi:K+-transporting ATPase KdpF subunit
MHILYIISGVISLVLLVYLILALLKPEWLE